MKSKTSTATFQMRWVYPHWVNCGANFVHHPICLASTSLGNVHRVFLQWKIHSRLRVPGRCLVHCIFFNSRSEKWNTWENFLIGTEKELLMSNAFFHGFTPVEITSGFVKIFFRPNWACWWSVPGTEPQDIEYTYDMFNKRVWKFYRRPNVCTLASYGA